MCGIAAVSLSPSSTIPIRQLAHELLLHSEERGKVASGFAFHYAGENKYIKAPKPGGHLSLKHLPKDARTVIAHTRNATYGNPEENDNNHPVVDDKEEIMLVHNGVITNHEAIRDGEKEVVFPEVDSSVLPWLIRTEGVKGLQHVDGWAAVAWLDNMQPGVLNLARVQGQAPMVVVFLEDGSTVMGSTFPIIHASLIRIGYGDQITGGYEVPDLTHIEVKAGTIGYMSNVPKYTQFGAKYKGKTMTHSEKQRLEKITNGDAVGYDDKTPVHAPKNATYTPAAPKPPTAGSLAGAGVSPAYKSPYSGGGTVGAGVRPTTTVSTYAPPEPSNPPIRKPGEDPMAAFERAKLEAPKRPTVSYSSTTANLRPLEPYLERRLRYWVEWRDQPDTFDSDIFISSDYETDGYLYNSFVEMCDEWHRANLATRWGVYDEKGVARWTHHLRTVKDEVEALRAIAKQLKPASARKIPPKIDIRATPDADDDLAEDLDNPLVLTADGMKPMFSLSDDEWDEQLRGYHGLH
jgi:Glucosamine 6-phosphate synthetase, contains amidotransferase and phosphosugar isomerase domains